MLSRGTGILAKVTPAIMSSNGVSGGEQSDQRFQNGKT